MAAPRLLALIVVCAAASLQAGQTQHPYQTGHTSRALFVGWSEDSSLVVSYSAGDGSLRFWDPLAGTLVAWTDTSIAPSIVKLPNGSGVRFSRPDNLTIDIRNAQTEQVLWRWRADRAEQEATSPDGRYVAVADRPGPSILIRTVATGELVQRLSGHPGVVRSLVFSPDRRLLASANGDGTVTIRDAATGALRLTLGEQDEPAVSVAFRDDGALLAAGSDDGTVRVWDTESGELRNVLKSHRTSVVALAFVPHGSLLASGGGSGDRTVKLWDTSDGRLVRTVEIPGSRGNYAMSWCCGSAVQMLAASTTGRRIAVGCVDGYTYMLDVEPGELTHITDGSGFRDSHQVVHAARFENDSTWEWIVAGGHIDAREAIQGSFHARWRIDSDTVTAMTIGSGLFATGTINGDVRVNLTRNGSRVAAWVGRHEIRSVALSPDGQFVAAGGDDQNITVWNIKTGRLVWSADRVGQRSEPTAELALRVRF